MTPRKLLAPLTGLVLAAVLPTGPAYAHTCSAAASPPQMNVDGTATGRANFNCLIPNPGTLTLYVCVEVATAPSLWNTYGCTTTTRTTGGIVVGSATAKVCAVSGGLLMRTTAYGVSGAGYNDYAESNPALVNCGVAG